MGFRRFNLDFPCFWGGAVGVDVGLGVLDSFSLRPLIREVVDLELME
jgi:hypothetical protein